MKHTANLDDPATKSDLHILEERLEEKFATKDDLYELENRLEKKFATKVDLQGLETRLEERFENKFALQRKLIDQDTRATINKAIETLQEQLSSFADKMYTRIDPLLREIENHRQDRELTTHTFEKHAKRIERLETLQGVTHEEN